MWALEVGHPANWIVHVPDAQSLRAACTIRLRPEGIRAIELLPRPVRKFESLLDRTIGSGEGEGTLHPTASIRINVEDTWANLALRPWARTIPYNSRAVVDRGLMKWANGGKINHNLLQAIRRQYPVAERALARYYEKNFGKPPKAAAALARQLLDASFRTHYVYSAAVEDEASHR